MRYGRWGIERCPAIRERKRISACFSYVIVLAVTALSFFSPESRAYTDIKQIDTDYGRLITRQGTESECFAKFQMKLRCSVADLSGKILVIPIPTA